MNVLSSIINLFLIVFAGLLIAFSPMLIITNLLIILKAKRPIMLSITLLAGIVTPLFLVGVLAANYIDANSEVSFRAVNDKFDLPPTIYIFVGLVMLVIAYVRYNRPPELIDEQSHKDTKIPEKVWPLFMFGFTRSLLSVTNIVAVLFVVKLITKNDLDPLVAIFVLLLTILIGLVPFFVMLYYHKFKKDTLLALNNKLDSILSQNLSSVITVIFVALGVFAIFDGLIGLIDK